MHAENPIVCKPEGGYDTDFTDLMLEVDLVDSITETRGGRVRRYGREEITGALGLGLIEDALAGDCQRLEVDFLLQGGGVYVKRLKKRVYQPYHSTLVIHHVDGKLACLFFAGDSMSCYMVISDHDVYANVDAKEVRTISVGAASLPEYVVHTDRMPVRMGLRFLLQNVGGADLRLSDCDNWSKESTYFAGPKKYEAMRRDWGLIKT